MIVKIVVTHGFLISQSIAILVWWEYRVARSSLWGKSDGEEMQNTEVFKELDSDSWLLYSDSGIFQSKEAKLGLMN